MNQGAVSGPISTNRGFVFLTVVDKRDPYVPKLDEVKDRVREEVLKQKAREFGQQKAVQLAAALKNARPTSRRPSRRAGFSSQQTTELLTRESPIPGLGTAAEVLDAAFKLPKDAVSDAITTEAGAAIVKVLEKQEVTDTEIAANKDRFREELLTDRRNRFYGAYLAKAKQKMKIEVNREVLQKMIS